MRTILEIPINDYYLCLSRFPLNSAEYRMLKNGVVLANEKGEEVVRILCETEIAQAIRKLFADACPEAAQRIKESPETNRL